jgi:predicted nucleotidyltransferase
MLSKLFYTKGRAEVLKVLFNGKDEELYFREIFERCDISMGSMQNEIKNLLEMDLIIPRKDGNRIYYKANTNHPIHPELVSIVEKTAGVQFLIKERLDDKVKCAFLFGSMATGKERSSSDIDIIIIGDGGLRHVSKLFVDLEQTLRREINPHVFTEKEFKKRINEKEHFITSVLKKKVIILKGDLNEFRKSIKN